MKTNRQKISIVVPCWNEEGNIIPLARSISENIPPKYSFEIIFVDDGSSDQTAVRIKKLASEDRKVKGIFLYKRAGHQQALRTGMESSKGDAIITMDADFQHPPSYIPTLISAWETGCDAVLAQKRETKNTSWWVKIGQKIGYLLWSFASGQIIVPRVSDFRLIDRKLSEAVLNSGEKIIFLRGLVRLYARKVCIVPYDVGVRSYGKSSYTLKMFINMFINGVISFSARPLRIVWLMGLSICIVASFYILGDIVFNALIQRNVVEGWKTLVLLMLILNGFMILYMGLLGEYISIIFRELKNREQPIVYEKINFDHEGYNNR